VLTAPPSRAFTRRLALFVAAWSLVWIGMGVWTRHEVLTLRELSDTVVKSGAAVENTGTALQGLGSVPFVGGDVARIGRQATAAGLDAQLSGTSSRSAVGRLATLLGIAIAVAPSVPMIALYIVVLRLARRLKPM
jgi:hypothetical protein